MFRQCLTYRHHYQSVVSGQDVPRNKYNLFQSSTGIYFPALNTSYTPSWPNANQLGRALGVLSGSLSVDTLLSAYVDTNWKDPQGDQPYALFVDQSFLSLPPVYYSDNWWGKIYDEYGEMVESLITAMGDYLGVDYRFDDVDNAVQVSDGFDWGSAPYMQPYINILGHPRHRVHHSPQLPHL